MSKTLTMEVTIADGLVKAGVPPLALAMTDIGLAAEAAGMPWRLLGDGEELR